VAVQKFSTQKKRDLKAKSKGATFANKGLILDLTDEEEQQQ